MDRLTDRIWRRVMVMVIASSLLLAGAGLLAVALGLLIAPHVGSAAAFAVIGVLVLAAGGGFLLSMRRGS